MPKEKKPLYKKNYVSADTYVLTPYPPADTLLTPLSRPPPPSRRQLIIERSLIGLTDQHTIEDSTISPYLKIERP